MSISDSQARAFKPDNTRRAKGFAVELHALEPSLELVTRRGVV
jgi:hypothetical protein